MAADGRLLLADVGLGVRLAAAAAVAEGAAPPKAGGYSLSTFKSYGVRFPRGTPKTINRALVLGYFAASTSASASGAQHSIAG